LDSTNYFGWGGNEIFLACPNSVKSLLTKACASYLSAGSNSSSNIFCFSYVSDEELRAIEIRYATVV